MIPLSRRSALAHRTALKSANGQASLKERPYDGKLILRGKYESINAPVQGVLDARLPQAAGGTSQGPHANLQWLSPDEWLIVTEPNLVGTVAEKLSAALSGTHSQITDVTDFYTTIELTGARAREMLMKIATIDFHPLAFKPGMCVTTNFGRTVAWARQPREDAFDLIVRISMADYLWCLLAAAGREWGLPQQEPKGGRVKLHLPHLEAPAADTGNDAPADLEIT